jgi:hypothetical protein
VSLLLPIDPEIIRKRAAIPAKIAELSYKDESTALRYIRIWGEKKMPITELFDALSKELQKEVS